MSLMNERNSITMASGSLSTCSSLVMAIMIPRSHGGLSTPYRRIIFGLSISDIIQSISLMLGPFFVPSDDNLSGSSWAIGNFYTCQFQGFAFTFGAATTCMYSLFLCLYYYCKLKRNMSDVTFAKKIERKVHCLIVLFNFAVCLSALATKTFNSLPRSASCQFTKKPYGCDPSVPGSCERGHLANIFSLLYFPVAVPCMCLFGMLFFMFSIVVHVYKRDRLFRSSRRQGNGNGEQETEADHVARLLRREVTLQVVFYVTAFLMTYGWIVLVTFLVRVNNSTPLFVVVIVAVFFPLMGLFNILIYTRPQVVAYRRLHRDTSWPVAFWRVLKAGGENPDAAAFSAEYSRQSPKCYKVFFCPRKKKQNQKQKVPSGLLRLRALCEYIESPRNGAPNQNHQEVIEPCSPGTNSMGHRISTITDHVEDQTEEVCSKDVCSSLSPDSKNYQAQDLNVVGGVNFLSTQKDAISKAFEKATQRAMALNVVNFCLTNTNAYSKESENRFNSEWSHGVSVGSFAGSLSGMEHEHDESLRLDDEALESQQS